MISIFSDGGARGNPGPAACGFALYINEKLEHRDAKFLGVTTNNVAEYNGVILALEWVIDNKLSDSIKFYLDSELVVRQLTGVYKIKNKDLITLAMKIKKMIKENKLDINFTHILRSKNKIADKLVNEKLDENSRH